MLHGAYEAMTKDRTVGMRLKNQSAIWILPTCRHLSSLFQVTLQPSLNSQIWTHVPTHFDWEAVSKRLTGTLYKNQIRLEATENTLRCSFLLIEGWCHRSSSLGLRQCLSGFSRCYSFCGMWLEHVFPQFLRPDLFYKRCLWRRSGTTAFGN